MIAHKNPILLKEMSHSGTEIKKSYEWVYI